MESQSNQPPVVVIVGQTASGKSALAMELAQQFGGEVIAADSRTIYKGMDIGTAKPTPAEQALVPHHLLDVVTPDEPFTVADFKAAAQAAITDITSRGKLPFLVGGSGLYIDAVIYDFSFRPPPDPAERQRLSSLTVDELRELLLARAIALPKNARNPRHLIRALETGGRIGGSHPLRANTLVLGLQLDREALRQNITARVETMIERGFVAEVQAVAATYGWEAQALQAPGYKAFRRYLSGDSNLEEAKELFIRADMQLAKRQRTWFKRNKSIHWVTQPQGAVDLVTTFLNK